VKKILLSILKIETSFYFLSSSLVSTTWNWIVNWDWFPTCKLHWDIQQDSLGNLQEWRIKQCVVFPTWFKVIYVIIDDGDS
jgi:hypothetical protein